MVSQKPGTLNQTNDCNEHLQLKLIRQTDIQCDTDGLLMQPGQMKRRGRKDVGSKRCFGCLFCLGLFCFDFFYLGGGAAGVKERYQGTGR